MTGVDIWAACALAVGGAALSLRGYMLKPDLRRWASAPVPVWLALLVFAIVQQMGLVTILGGSHATPREAVIYTAGAVAAVVMLVNLARQRPEANLVREILDHLSDGLVTAPREAIGRTLDAIREAAKRAGFHA